MGARALSWKPKTWSHSPHLEAWQKKILGDLKSRVPREKGVLWILSSGTQAVKSVKVIGLTREAVMIAAEAANRHLQSSKSDRWLVAIPTYHIGGLSIYARASLNGARVYEFGGKWNPARLVKVLSESKITLTSLVPTQVYDLVTAGLVAPQSLRAAVIGGGALDPSLYARARRLRWPLLPSYGLTECCSQVATASLDSLGSDGYPPLVPLSHVQVDLREQRIYIKSESLCRWIAGGRSDGQFTLEDPRRDGWFATEDAAESVAGGLKILGRRDDVVKILGVLVPVLEVEQQARASIGWDEFFLLPQKNARSENHLLLVTDSTRSLREWQRKVDSYNSVVKGPRRIHGICWVPRIPANEMGKIRKAALVRTLFAQGLR
jgi:O-succinylbenzoic acid--CoA ligase